MTILIVTEAQKTVKSFPVHFRSKGSPFSSLFPPEFPCAAKSAYYGADHPALVTCSECIASEVFKNAVYELELVFEGNFLRWRNEGNFWKDEYKR